MKFLWNIIWFENRIFKPLLYEIKSYQIRKHFSKKKKLKKRKTVVDPP